MAKDAERAIKQSKVKSDTLAAAVKKLSAQGLSQREIAGKFGTGVDTMTVNAILKGFRPSEEFMQKPKRKS